MTILPRHRTIGASILLLILFAVLAGHTRAQRVTAQPAPLRPPAMHIEMTGSVTVQDRRETITVPVRGSGDFNLDPANFSSRMHFIVGDLVMGVLEFDLLIVNNAMYMRLGLGPWHVEQLPFALQQLINSSATPSDKDFALYLEALGRAGITLTRLPDETINGIATRHERVDASAAQLHDLANNLPPWLMAGLGLPVGPALFSEATPNASLNSRITMDFWTGVDDSFVYRLSQKEVTTGRFGTITIDMTMDFTPLSAPVPLVAPL